MEVNKIYQGDCLEELKKLPDSSVDAIVTDPPYELGFMGKGWDSTGIANNVDMWKECLRVLKPGGYLLSFGGTRTYHRMASAIEDAGFEIRDMIEWVYGSGFPKSLNIGKAIDKIAPRLGQFDGFAKHLTEQIKKSGKTQKQIASLFPSKTGGVTGCVWNWANGANVPTLAQWHILKPLLNLSDDFLPLIERIEAEREYIGTKTSGIGKAFTKDGWGSGHDEVSITKGNSEWEGWGTALKPAHEPICMARKPLGQQELDIAKNICYNITEKGLITNSKIIWRIKNVKNAEQLKTKFCSTQTPQQKMVVISAETVETKENESVGKKIQKLIENICESGMQETGNKPEKQVLKVISKTKTEYQDTGKNISESEKKKPSESMAESAIAVEKQDLSSLPLTISEAVEENTEKKSKTEISMSSLKSMDTQKTDTDCSVQTATSQWVCMDIVRTIKVSFEGKEYDFDELSDGSLVWNENLEPYRKQQKLNVVENVLKYGTGGINIDESRVETNAKKWSKPKRGIWNESEDNGATLEENPLGRFPANLIHDNSEEVRECFPETAKSKKAEVSNKGIWGSENENKEVRGHDDNGGNASRFFKSIIYTAKASKSERNRGCEGLEEHKIVTFATANGTSGKPSSISEGRNTIYKNNHPTVKPIALMEYLINMVTKEGQTVLDPFTGSGTTLIACKNLGRNYIGIELEPEYVKIAEERLRGTTPSML